MSDGEGPAGDEGADVAGSDGDDPDWSVHSTRREYADPWFAVNSDLVERPDGERARYYWLDRGDAVGLVPVTDDGEVVFVEEYRPQQRSVVRSLPAGAVGEDEDFRTAGARELREETGYRAGELRLLDTLVDTSWHRRTFGVVAATELAAGAQQLDDGEFIDVVSVPASRAVSAAREGPGPPVAWTLAALLLARETGLLPG